MFLSWLLCFSYRLSAVIFSYSSYLLTAFPFIQSSPSYSPYFLTVLTIIQSLLSYNTKPVRSQLVFLNTNNNSAQFIAVSLGNVIKGILRIRENSTFEIYSYNFVVSRPGTILWLLIKFFFSYSFQCRVLLNLRTSQPFEDVLEDLGQVLKINGAKKMYTGTGQEVCF